MGGPLPPLLWLCIIKCYYLHPVRLLSHPLIKSVALRKLTTSYANWKTEGGGGQRKKQARHSGLDCGILCSHNGVSSFHLLWHTSRALMYFFLYYSRKLQVPFHIIGTTERWISLKEWQQTINGQVLTLVSSKTDIAVPLCELLPSNQNDCGKKKKEKRKTN